jgi:hypothetical protein
MIHFNPRWREELVATSDEGVLILELTMGKYHVYFPSHDKWKETAPGWAKEKWEVYLSATRNWCSQNNIPISVVDNGLVYEEKEKF